MRPGMPPIRYRLSSDELGQSRAQAGLFMADECKM
ncbi:Uncharacterised protein [Aeromonas encheleia]|nr:Uncharacterised protein [Aeromonas encheleia]